MKKHRTISYAARLLACALAMLAVITAFAAPAGAAGERFRLQVEVHIPGGGTAVIEGCDYVEREDPEQEMYARGWTLRNGSALMPTAPTGGRLTVPANTGTASFVWEFDESDVVSQELYCFRITQVSGTEPLRRYDDNVYLLEIFIHEEEGRLIPTAQLRDDDAPGTERDRKPPYCEFINRNLLPATDDPPLVKIVEGKPSRNGTFTFLLQPNDPTNPMPESTVDGVCQVTITGAGESEFGVITFTEVGVYDYIATEKNTGEKGYTYDKTAYVFRYEVTEEGDRLVARRRILKDGEEITTITAATFTNVYTPDKPGPKSGDDSPLGLWIGMGTVSLAGVIALIVVLARSRKRER